MRIQDSCPASSSAVSLSFLLPAPDSVLQSPRLRSCHFTCDIIAPADHAAEPWSVGREDMHVETRRLTEQELAMAVAAYTVAPRGGISAVAYYGMYAILVPMIGGGAIAQLFRLVGVRDSFAFPLGLLAASVGSLLLFLGNRRLDIRQRMEGEAIVDSLKTSGRVSIYVVNVEDFQWEEPYVLGVYDQAGYRRLRKTQPSYRDVFVLESIEAEADGEWAMFQEDLGGNVRRKSDGRRFLLGLSELRAVDETTPNRREP